MRIRLSTLLWILVCVSCFLGGLMIQPPQFLTDDPDNGMPAVSPVAGNVLELNGNTALLSLGTDDGIQRGDTILLSRGDVFLGKAIVTRSQANVSICEIPETLSEVQRGDSVQIPADPPVLPAGQE